MKLYFFRIALLTFIILVSQRCVYHDLPSPPDCSENPIILHEESNTDSECGAATGAFEVSALGGGAPYTFAIAGSTQSSGSFSGLAAGTYEVTVTDQANCVQNITVSINNSDGVNLELTSSPGGCNSSMGTISAVANNGVEPYSFRIDEGVFHESSSFSDLPAGSYTVTVKDATGCEAARTIRVQSGVSFQADISPIISTNCTISGCHNGTQFPDLRNFANIKANASQIKALTSSRAMPQNGSLTQAQIDMIACWVDDGAPSN
jgi:hypothetical protein